MRGSLLELSGSATRPPWQGRSNVNHFIFITATMALRSAYLDYGPPYVVGELPRQTERRCAPLVSAFVR